MSFKHRIEWKSEGNNTIEGSINGYKFILLQRDGYVDAGQFEGPNNSLTFIKNLEEVNKHRYYLKTYNYLLQQERLIQCSRILKRIQQRSSG